MPLIRQALVHHFVYENSLLLCQQQEHVWYTALASAEQSRYTTISSPKQPACNLALAMLTQLHTDDDVQQSLLKTVHVAPCLNSRAGSGCSNSCTTSRAIQIHNNVLATGSCPKQPACNLALAMLTQLHTDDSVQQSLLETVHVAPCLNSRAGSGVQQQLHHQQSNPDTQQCACHRQQLKAASNLALAMLTQLHTDDNFQQSLLKTVHVADTQQDGNTQPHTPENPAESQINACT